MKNKFLLLLCMSVVLFACKKNRVQSPQPPAAAGTQLKLPLGKPTGDAIITQIGANGGSFQSADGVIKVTVPAGAVENNVSFSVQPVENTLGSKALSYRLKPEGVNFKKPVTITYNYASINLGTTNPKHLFLACQDAEGNYFSAKNTKGNVANHTLTVETTHFSDWTFYALYDFWVKEGNVVDGKIRLAASESAELGITRHVPKPADGDLDALLVPLSDPIIANAGWELLPKKGILTVNQFQGKATYKAPVKIDRQEEVIVTAMMNGELGKDNEGNLIRQMQLAQPITLTTDDYFILTENGNETNATEFSGEYIQLLGTQIFAKFPNGYNLSCYAYGGTGNYAYYTHGTPGKATLELVPGDGKGYIVFRPEDCTQPKDLVYSPGSFTVTSVAMSVGQYFEGHFTCTMFKFNYCEGGGSKTISGRFRIRKKV
jgi:hypothetical protein